LRPRACYRRGAPGSRRRTRRENAHNDLVHKGHKRR
jgi:hypothetical protein